MKNILALFCFLASTGLAMAQSYTYDINVDAQYPGSELKSIVLLEGATPLLRVLTKMKGATYTNLADKTATMYIGYSPDATGFITVTNSSTDISNGSFDLQFATTDTATNGDFWYTVLIKDATRTFYTGSGKCHIKETTVTGSAAALDLTTPLNWDGFTYVGTETDGPVRPDGVTITSSTNADGSITLTSVGGGGSGSNNLLYGSSTWTVTGPTVNGPWTGAVAAAYVSSWDGAAASAAANAASVTVHRAWLTGLNETNNGNYARIGTNEGSIATLNSTITNIPATSVRIDCIGSCESNTLHDWFNDTQSAGLVTGGTITTNIDGTSVNVASGIGFIKSSDSVLGETVYFDFTNSTVPVTSNTLTRIYIDYNSGTPLVSATTGNLSGQSKFAIASAIYEQPGKVEFVEGGQPASDFLRRVHTRLRQDGLVRTSGLVIGAGGTNNVSMTAGSVWAGLNNITHSAIDTKSGDVIEKAYYYDGTSWLWLSDSNKYDNGRYNDITSGLVALSPYRYAVHWFFVCNEGDLYSVYGQGNYTLAQAENATVPADLPNYINSFCTLIGKIIVKKGLSTATEVSSAFTTSFAKSIVTDHGDLSGLAANDHPQYALTNAAVVKTLSVGSTSTFGDDITLGAQSGGFNVIGNTNLVVKGSYEGFTVGLAGGTGGGAIKGGAIYAGRGGALETSAGAAILLESGYDFIVAKDLATVAVRVKSDGDFISKNQAGFGGNTSPTNAVDVAGTVKATAFVGDGSGLTGIVAGNPLDGIGRVATNNVNLGAYSLIYSNGPADWCAESFSGGYRYIYYYTNAAPTIRTNLFDLK